MRATHGPALRRRAVLGICAATVAQAASAQAWPSRPVRIVVPFPAGGPADAIGRIMSERLTELWRQPVIIENRGGAGGNIGADLVAKSAPDGYTLLLMASSHVQGAGLYRNLSFDPIRDFTPIAQFAYYSLVMAVHPSVAANNLPELEALMRANPSGLAVASAGVGTPTHLAAELLRIRAGIGFIHVPFQGAAPAHAALLAGQVQAMIYNPVLAVPAIQAGRLRAIATTGPTRATTLPSTPTFAESGHPGFEIGVWYALAGPAGLPASLVARIHADVRQVIAQPSVRDRFAAQSLETRDLGPDALTSVMTEELARWTALIRQLGISSD
jgi:tripartite-type tricarboxylate transporter receptor subunit TctC